uniref:Uncharacterized protein n=1 Tax=Vitis vinifera TaxID=29760 RepID=A5ATT3_VITVI|nr:hypothetical protein VITISV_035873 [Vitis vinifera]
MTDGEKDEAERGKHRRRRKGDRDIPGDEREGSPPEKMLCDWSSPEKMLCDWSLPDVEHSVAASASTMRAPSSQSVKGAPQTRLSGKGVRLSRVVFYYLRVQGVFASPHPKARLRYAFESFALNMDNTISGNNLVQKTFEGNTLNIEANYF